MRLESSAFSHVGRRENNEDAYCVMNELGLFAVADGMGGYEGGEVASKLTIQSIQEFFQRQANDKDITWPFSMNKELSWIENTVYVSIRLAHHSVLHKKKGALSSMGSTIAMIAFYKNQVVIGHLGDSRVYRFRKGKLKQITQDHSLYEFQKKSCPQNMPSYQEYPYANIVTQAVGMPGDMRPEVHTEFFEKGDIYLLCTDGLSDVLSQKLLAQRLEKGFEKTISQQLAEEAYQEGGKDNITALLVRVSPQ